MDWKEWLSDFTARLMMDDEGQVRFGFIWGFVLFAWFCLWFVDRVLPDLLADLIRALWNSVV